MLSACRQHYQNDPQMIKNIDKFDKTYLQKDCIRWYTKDTFVYKLINAALRTEDIEQLYVYRYYIADLSRQLAQQFKNLKESKKEKIYLFRGTTITEEEEKKINANVGKLFAINSYWSTSRDRSYALTFAKEEMHRSDTAEILYEIECDLEDQNDSVIFADISGLSEFPVEAEYLFDAGSIFQIKDVRKEEKPGNKQYIVQIKTTREGQEVAKSYIDEIQAEIEYESPRIMIGILLKRIGKYDKSLEYFEQLLENPGEEKIAHIHNRIGIALRLQHKYDSALEHYNIAYDLTSKSNPPERVYLAFIRHDQGQIYFKQRKYSKALKYYEEAVDIIKKEKGDINRYIADYYTSLGRLYTSRHDYEKAMHYQKKALSVREKYLPPTHVNHAFSYFEIAKLLSFQKDYKKALEYHLKALKLRQDYLLSNHLNTALSLHSVGQIYYKLDDLENARYYYWKALEMNRKCLPDSRAYIIPTILQDIARTYSWESQEALNYRLEARNIQQSAEPVHYPSLARLLDDIGSIYKLIGRMDDAVEYYQEALKIREEKLPKRSYSLSYSFNNLAYLYEAMNDMASAIVYHRKALEIYEYYKPDDHWLCEMSRRSIQRVMRWLKQRSESESIANKLTRI
jgi:tetratricopeptide (TPR) repeat protein